MGPTYVVAVLPKLALRNIRRRKLPQRDGHEHLAQVFKAPCLPLLQTPFRPELAVAVELASSRVVPPPLNQSCPLVTFRQGRAAPHHPRAGVCRPPLPEAYPSCRAPPCLRHAAPARPELRTLADAQAPSHPNTSSPRRAHRSTGAPRRALSNAATPCSFDVEVLQQPLAVFLCTGVPSHRRLLRATLECRHHRVLAPATSPAPAVHVT
jgi:hypothetical protein